MNLIEAKTIPSLKAETQEQRTACIFLQSHLYCFTGKWTWDLQTEAIFCSDVMFAAGGYYQFTATPCLIHPEDIPDIRKLIELGQNKKPVNLQFRVITSHGLLTTIRGEGIMQYSED